MTTVIFVNGKRSRHVSALDRGLQYGDGLFETLRAHAGRIDLLEYHLDRLLTGCQRLKLKVPRRAAMRAEIERVAAPASKRNARAAADLVIKMIVTRGKGARGYRAPAGVMATRIVTCESASQAINLSSPVSIRVCDTLVAEQPQLAGLKTLNRLDSVLARSEWRGNHVLEGLMLDGHGHIVCGTMSNVFVAHGNKLSTPPIRRAGVAGVMRRWVLENAYGVKLEARERLFGLALIERSPEVFITNAVIGIRSVGRISMKGHSVDKHCFSAADALRALFAAR